MERRITGEPTIDRRAFARGGRRNGDQGKPWYVRRPLLLAMASLISIGWRRLRERTPNS
jgi:hypothetical protein